MPYKEPGRKIFLPVAELKFWIWTKPGRSKNKKDGDETEKKHGSNFQVIPTMVTGLDLPT